MKIRTAFILCLGIFAILCTGCGGNADRIGNKTETGENAEIEEIENRDRNKEIEVRVEIEKTETEIKETSTPIPAASDEEKERMEASEAILCEIAAGYDIPKKDAKKCSGK